MNSTRSVKPPGDVLRCGAEQHLPGIVQRCDLEVSQHHPIEPGAWVFAMGAVALAGENSRSKRLVADLTLDKHSCRSCAQIS